MAEAEVPLPELTAINLLRDLVGPPHGDDVWIGDDAAVLSFDERNLLFATDVAVEGVHFDRRFGALADVGWRALVQNLSDVAAMGGLPRAAIVAVVGAKATELSPIYDGLLAASRQFACPVVGGDLSDGSLLVISIAVIGELSDRAPVLRTGARPGDAIYVTGPLGGAAAGLRLLRADPGSSDALVAAFLRPVPRLAEGRAASAAGARAMIDVSDGLGIDLHRLADASRVGFALETLPFAPGVTEEEAIAGGEDYELVFCAPGGDRVLRAFSEASLRPPVRIGSVVSDMKSRTLRGERLQASGFEHRLGSFETG